jgi:hypothetical protein
MQFVSEVWASGVITCIASGRFLRATYPPPLQIVSIWAIFTDSLFNLFYFSQFWAYPVNNSATSTGKENCIKLETS